MEYAVAWETRNSTGLGFTPKPCVLKNILVGKLAEISM